MNLKHLTNYTMFADFTKKHINLYRTKFEPEFKKVCKIDTLGNVINKYTKSVGGDFYSYFNSLYYNT